MKPIIVVDNMMPTIRGKLIHYRRGNETTDETISTMRNKLPSVLLELNTGKSIAILD